MKAKIFSILGIVTGVLFALIIALDVIFPLRYFRYVKSSCREFSVAPSAVLAIIWTESKFRPAAKSKAGACGLMQLMPSTAEWLCEELNIEYDESKLFDPQYNIRLGVRYLSYLEDNFEGDYVFAAYNAGEGNVKKWLSSGEKDIPFEETRIYIRRINWARALYKLRVRD